MKSADSLTDEPRSRSVGLLPEGDTPLGIAGLLPEAETSRGIAGLSGTFGSGRGATIIEKATRSCAVARSISMRGTCGPRTVTGSCLSTGTATLGFVASGNKFP